MQYTNPSEILQLDPKELKKDIPEQSEEEWKFLREKQIKENGEKRSKCLRQLYKTNGQYREGFTNGTTNTTMINPNMILRGILSQKI